MPSTVVASETKKLGFSLARSASLGLEMPIPTAAQDCALPERAKSASVHPQRRVPTVVIVPAEGTHLVADDEAHQIGADD